MNRDSLTPEEVFVFFNARVNNVFLLGAELRSVGRSNKIDYPEFGLMHPRNQMKN